MPSGTARYNGLASEGRQWNKNTFFYKKKLKRKNRKADSAALSSQNTGRFLMLPFQWQLELLPQPMETWKRKIEPIGKKESMKNRL
jgi:hypothetical protein